jgi:hypothetical protein
MKSVTIVVPTYWSWERDNDPQPGDAVYDHPTPIDTNGTLARLLESLKIIDYPDWDILIISVAANTALEVRLEAKIREIISPFKQHFSIYCFSTNNLKQLRERLSYYGFDPISVGLSNYSTVRNCQLIMPNIMGSDVIVALDDDEIIEDKDYIYKATEFIGEEHEDTFIAGVCGFYLDKHGGIHLPECPSDNENIFIRKLSIMNAATDTIKRKSGRLVISPFAFGGNMVFSRQMFEQISFDPHITRGEDIDYLINARLQGYSFFIDKELTITHLPPAESKMIAYSKLRQDVIRFIYEREKLRVAQQHSNLVRVLPEDLDPYPGLFLREGLTHQALEALRLQRPTNSDSNLFPPPERIVADAVKHAQQFAPRYLEFAMQWPLLMQALVNDRILLDKFKMSKNQ